MKKILIALAFLPIVGAFPFLLQRAAMPPVRVSLIHTSRGLLAPSNDVSVTANGQRIYFTADSTRIMMYDRATSKEVQILELTVHELAVSPTGDRLGFLRTGEDGSSRAAKPVWTLSLDPRTGLANGTPRRASTRASLYQPSFSPDGRTIAFGVMNSDTGQSIYTVPAAGGPEREIARMPGQTWPIQWTPDGNNIFFGLDMNTESATWRNGTYRVPAAGGTPRFVLRAANSLGAVPGLSPDGRHIMVWSPSWDSTIVATSDGTELGVHYDGDQAGDTWLSTGHLLRVERRRPSTVRVRPFSSGSPRAIADSLAALNAAQWSPDGRMIASVVSVRFGGIGTRVVITNSTGGARREIKLSRPLVAGSLRWSPDGSSLAYVSIPVPSEIILIDVRSGALRSITRASGRILVLPRWRSDSRALFYGGVGAARTADSSIAITIHEVSVTGTSRALRTVGSACGPPVTPECRTRVISDSLVVEFSRVKNGDRAAPESPLEYRVFGLYGSDTGRVLYSRITPGQQIPTFSSNGHWMAVREVSPTAENRRLELISVRANTKRTIPISFATAAGAYNPWISDDGREMIVAEERTADSTLVFHRVDVATGRVTRITSIPRPQRPAIDLAISPDGRSILYTTIEAPFTRFYDVDISGLLMAPQRHGGAR